MSDKQKNVLGEDLEECSNNPLTGWYRDGCCNTDENDHGVHTVCAKVTTEFLEWLKVAGNDLIKPHPEFGFPGLKDGDGWGRPLPLPDFQTPLRSSNAMRSAPALLAPP